MIAIHERHGSFSDRWIEYCKKKCIPFKIVNCYKNDIITQLDGCKGLMWHWHHEDYRDQLFARQITLSIEAKGIKVFPSSNTSWHFDDKIGQKYLLEAIEAPIIPTYIFYSKDSASQWINKTEFPKVFKLRGGAGSLNVKLCKSKKEAQKIVSIAFKKGFPMTDKYAGINQRIWILQRDKDFKSIVHFFKGIFLLIAPKKIATLLPQQKGYVYFQDFVPDNLFDDRIIIIGKRAIAIRRYVRDKDFRASGSGLIAHDYKLFNIQSIQLAFDIAKKIDSQSLAFDFVYNDSNKPMIAEISYAYSMGPAYDKCPGYWDNELVWHYDNVNPQFYIIEDFINSIKKRG